MSVNSVNNAANAANSSSNSSSVANKTDFMALLIAQLTHQDPLNPMEDSDFTSQLAQLEQLEQTVSLNTTMGALNTQSQLQSATALIGMEVTGSDSSGNVVTGTVLRAVQSGNSVFVELSGGQKIPVANVSNVSNSESSLSSEIASSANAIGMWIQADGGSSKTIEGIVKEIVVKNGQVMLNLYGGQSVSWSQVSNMRLPTEDETVWYTMSDELREKAEAAQGAIGMAVTGVDADGKAVSGIVMSAQVNNGKVYLVLLDGTKIDIDDVDGEPRTPTAKDAEGLIGLQATGLDEDGNQYSGIIAGVEDREDGLALILEDGTHLYYDSLLDLSVPEESSEEDGESDKAENEKDND